MKILFVRAIITSTARVSTVFLPRYRNTVLNQSARVFALFLLFCELGYTFLFLPHFDVICDLLLNRHTATSNLFVK